MILLICNHLRPSITLPTTSFSTIHLLCPLQIYWHPTIDLPLARRRLPPQAARCTQRTTRAPVIFRYGLTFFMAVCGLPLVVPWSCVGCLRRFRLGNGKGRDLRILIGGIRSMMRDCIILAGTCCVTTCCRIHRWIDDCCHLWCRGRARRSLWLYGNKGHTLRSLWRHLILLRSRGILTQKLMVLSH